MIARQPVREKSGLAVFQRDYGGSDFHAGRKSDENLPATKSERGENGIAPEIRKLILRNFMGQWKVLPMLLPGNFRAIRSIRESF